MPRRQQKCASNIFKTFDQRQIQEFKEAFSLIDQNRDGLIDKDDLKRIFLSLGEKIAENELSDMLTDAIGPLNFTAFVTLFAERMEGTDPEEVIHSAFQCFDEKGTGLIDAKRLHDALTTTGHRYTDDQAAELLKGLKTKDGMFVYAELINRLKRGTEC